MPAFHDIGEYYKHVKNIFARSGCSDDWHLIKVRADHGRRGVVFSGGPLRFKKDEAIFEFREAVIIDDVGAVERPMYFYKYERVDENGHCFFFRYDRAPGSAKPLIHEECHLHVNQEEPRFKTHETCFEEIFGFIAAHFYEVFPERLECQR